MSLGCVQETVAAIFALYLDAVKAFTQVLYMKLNKGKMTRITDLPVEIIAKILTFLPAEDHASMSRVCKMFYEASNIEYVWLNRCREEFKVDASSSNFTSKEIYTELLYKYGYLLGFWQPEISSYGGLLHVQYEDGKLIGMQLTPYPSFNINLPLHRKQQFRIELNEDAEAQSKCTDCFEEIHKGKITRNLKLTPHLVISQAKKFIQKLGRNKFAFDCLESNSHVAGTNTLLEVDMDRAFDMLFFDDFLVHFRHRCCLKYNRVFLPKKRTNVPIQPGVFKGTYVASGLAIIMLDYDGLVAKAVIVMGNPNVPAGKVTFMAELEKSMVLTYEDQTSINQLKEISNVRKDYDASVCRSQPFKVPKECLVRFMGVPNSCIGRFSAGSQIAGRGFTNASFTHGHWIIFNEDLFGFLWLELRRFSMFGRAKEVV